MLRRTPLVTLFCACCLVCLCQDNRQYTFVHYGTDKGLAAYDVRAVAQDKTGYVWVGTINGLQRFDGTRFTSFYHRPNDPASIPDNHILQLASGAGNSLWIITAAGHAGLFDTKQFRFKEVAINPANPRSLRCDKKIVFDSRGHVFLECFRSELLVYNEKSNSFVPSTDIIPPPPRWSTSFFCEDVREQKCYIGSDSGLVVYNMRTRTISYARDNRAADPVIRHLGGIHHIAPALVDSKHRLWLLQWTPTAPSALLYCYDLTSNKILLNNYSFWPAIGEYHEPRELLEQKDGTIWIRGFKIFARYNEQEKKFRLIPGGYVNGQRVSLDVITDMIEDAGNNLWMATSNNGLYRFNPHHAYFINVRHINRCTQQPGDGEVMSFQADGNNSFLMGTWSNGLYRYDSAFNALPLNIHGIVEKNNELIWCMQPGRNNNIIWMGRQPGGLYQYNRQTHTATSFGLPALEQSTVRQLTEDAWGHLWIGTHTKGLFKYTNTGNGYNFNKKIQPLGTVDSWCINALCLDSTGLLWAGTASNGAYVIDPRNEQVRYHLHRNGPPGLQLSTNDVTGIFVYNDSSVIIAAGGLHVYNTRTHTVKKLCWPNDLPAAIYGIQKDRNGYLWLSLSEGLCRMKPQQERSYLYFNRINGILNDQFVIGAAAGLPNGKLLFGNTNQFIAFDPQQVNITTPLPRVTITGFKVRNHPLPVDSLLRRPFVELPPEQNALTIDFSELQYCCSSVITYKLHSIDNDWVTADANNQAVYPYLPPGTYTFMVRTEDSEGRQSHYTTTLVIKIKPHFWATWWFFSLVLFAALGIFLWIDKLRLQKIKATESVRTRIASSLTEDMGNSLNTINIISELAKTKVGIDHERTRDYINQVSDASNRMIQAMYDMVWSINPGNDTLQHTIHRMRYYAAEMESLYTPVIMFQVDEQAADIRLNMEMRYELLSIFKEALHNAARHAHAKYIQVTIRYKRPSLSICIRDDGRGFDVQQVELSRGLSDMRRRAAAIHAVFYIKSEINTGTMVQFEVFGL